MENKVENRSQLMSTCLDALKSRIYTMLEDIYYTM